MFERCEKFLEFWLKTNAIVHFEIAGSSPVTVNRVVCRFVGGIFCAASDSHLNVFLQSQSIEQLTEGEILPLLMDDELYVFKVFFVKSCKTIGLLGDYHSKQLRY